MKSVHSILTAGLALAILGTSALALTLPVSEDSSTSGNAAVAKSAGKGTTLAISSARQGLIRFEAGAFANSISAGDVSKARLVIFISGLTSPGALTLHRITQDWSEHGASLPAFDAKPLATIPQSSVVAKQFLIIDVTAAVQAWLREPGTDFGFAIAGSGGARVLLGAKEGPAAGHPAQLQIETGAAFMDEEDIAEGGRTRASATAPIGNFVTNADLVNNSIKGKKLRAASVTGAKLALETVTSANILDGTITNADISASFTFPGVANGSIGPAQLAADLTLGGTTTGTFAGSGAGLTLLNASQLASGAVPDGRLSANVALRAGGNTFTGNQTFDGLRLQSNTTSPNVIGGFSANSVTAGLAGGSIGGGGANTAPNQVTAGFGTIGGGFANTVNGQAGTVSGGTGNTAGPNASVGGGGSNIASGDSATIGGGIGNTASGGAATVGGGGRFNIASASTATVAGGDGNTASGVSASVGGGKGNVASGANATIPGGDLNAATTSAFAAGHRAKASHAGAFVWADSTNADFASTAADQFLIRATGNVGIGTGSPLGKLHIQQPTGGAPTLELQGGEAEGVATPSRSGLAFSYFEPGVAKHFITTNHSVTTAANNLMGFWLNNGTTNTTTNTPGNGTVQVMTLSGDRKVSMIGNGTSNSTPAGHVVLIRDVSGSDVNGLAIQSPFGGTHLTSDNFITFFNSNSVSIGSIEGNGGGSVQLSGVGSDYAEYLPKADPGAKIEAAEIVGVRDGRIVARGDEADQFMVVTNQAIVAGNRPSENADDLAKRSLVSFIGQVPVRVRGAVKSGDYILASEKGDGTGVAMAAEAIAPSAMHRIVGRAWEASDEAEVKTVNTAVGLDQTGLAAPALEKLERENRELRARLAALEAKDQAREARLTRLENAREDRPARAVSAALGTK